jgi:hypothetical protein
MTIAGLDTPGAPEEQTPGNKLFHVSLTRLDQLNRSAVHLIAGRLTETCPSYGKALHELDPAQLIREIREFHDDTEDFIRYDMPIKEIVFRTLLASGNEPSPLGDLHGELTERWSNALRPISITESFLLRIMEADTYYGFAEA